MNTLKLIYLPLTNSRMVPMSIEFSLFNRCRPASMRQLQNNKLLSSSENVWRIFDSTEKPIGSVADPMNFPTSRSIFSSYYSFISEFWDMIVVVTDEDVTLMLLFAAMVINEDWCNLEEDWDGNYWIRRGGVVAYLYCM